MKSYIAEFIGAGLLVLIGCGAVAIGGYGGDGAAGVLTIAAAFGLGLMAIIYLIGPISGCHINPAVTIGLAVGGRFEWSKVPGYVIAQCAGAIAGAGLLLFILQGQTGGYDVATSGLGQNGFGAEYLGEYSVLVAFLAEVIATAIFVRVILTATCPNHGVGNMAGVVIGLTLLLLHLPFIQITGLSVNPARSLGPALFTGSEALADLWLFIVAPIVGAAIAGITAKNQD